MARRKKPEGETADQAESRHTLETIANRATRSEKVSWDRKMDNMVKLLASLRPLEELITDMMAQKMPIMDQITALRAEMVKECVHPYQMLLLTGGVIVCKFCDHRFSVRKDSVTV